jgi:N-acetyl-1-D-myo-inositol-2-amino-2-deoxy-alpha-D-glucopyranoside deacetylase
MAGMPRNPLVNPRSGDVVAFLHAHPDDESIFTGGTIARVAAARADAVVIMATLGERGRPSDPLVQAELGENPPLADVRKEELGRACAALGAADLMLLGAENRFVDSGVHPDGWSDGCLVRSRAAGTEALVALLRDLRPHVLVTFDAGGCTGHPDHVACHDIARAAAAELSRDDDRLLHLAVVVDPLPRPRLRPRAPADELTAVDVLAVRGRKAAAVSCHFSQVGDAVEDRARLAEYDPRTAVAQYLPRVLSNRPVMRHELYRFVPAERLLARLAPRVSRTGSDRLTSQPALR